MSRLVALATLLALAVPASAQTLVSREIPFQGILQDDGTPVTDATDVTFALFESASDGTAIWTEAKTVTPDASGSFAVRLGAVTALPDALGRPLWLEVSVTSGGGTQVLGPRTAFGAAPYALGLYGLTVTPSRSSDRRGPNLVGGSPANSIGPDVGGATISGGGSLSFPNTVTEIYGTVGGGASNTAGGASSTVGGGQFNTASGGTSTVSGGDSNTASGGNSTVGGGFGNIASSSRSTVGGGLQNTAGGSWSTVPGGRGNQARGDYSFAGGHYARAAHNGTFAWSDDSRPFTDSLVSTGPHQFLVRAAGGFGLNTNAPLAEIHVRGEDRSLQVSALENDEIIVEAEDAALGLYSSPGGRWGSAISLGEVDDTGAITTKWGIARRTGADDAGLYFTFGTNNNYASNDAQMRIDTDGSVHADDAFVGGGADLAEYFPLATSETATASVQPGDLVGLWRGKVSLNARGADQVMIASSNPAFIGNPDAEASGALVALVGQAEVRVTGTANVGDLLVASGQDDGTARAVAPEAYRPEADGPVAGRVLALPEAGRAVALVGVDEAAALRAVVSAQAAQLDAQQDQLTALRADLDRLLQRLNAEALALSE